MLRIEREQRKLTRLQEPKMSDISLTERYHLQQFIYNSPADFFAEIGESLFVIAQEVQPSEIIQDRIDLLALDSSGNAVIIELKRSNDKLQLLQAISYASMVSHWEPEKFLALAGAREEELRNFLRVDPAEINRDQRIILIAEAYDYEVLISAEWLHEGFEVDVRCCRIAVSSDSTPQAEYLSCSIVYPPPELREEAIARKRPRATDAWANWDAALGSIRNKELITFFRSELANGRESNLNDPSIIFRINGIRRWFLAARQLYAYCWQVGRFEKDVEFWRKELSTPDSVVEVNEGACLRFHVSTQQDFQVFKRKTEELSQWRDEK